MKLPFRIPKLYSNLIIISSIFVLTVGCPEDPPAEPVPPTHTLVLESQDSASAGGTIKGIKASLTSNIENLTKINFNYSVKSGGGSLSKYTDTVGLGEVSTFDWKLGRTFEMQTVEVTATFVTAALPIATKIITEQSIKKLDAEEYEYNTTQIGDKIWLADNLGTRKYNDGTPLLLYLDSAQWTDATEGAYAHVNNDINNFHTYGLLYNAEAIKSNKGICPLGSHVATNAEWKALIEYAGGENDAGNTLRSKDNWGNASGVSNDSLLMSIQPAGYIDTEIDFFAFGSQTIFWAAADGSGFGEGPFFTDGGYMFFTEGAAPIGYSCRCVLD